MEDQKRIILGRVYGEGYSDYADKNFVLDPEGICGCVQAHFKLQPQLIIEKREIEDIGKTDRKKTTVPEKNYGGAGR